jgi:cysteinyl-tRNA synthetase
MLHALAKIIGFNLDRNKSGFLITVLSDHHVALVDRYAQARLEKDWPTADGIRDQLAKDGIILSVARDGTVSWRKA